MLAPCYRAGLRIEYPEPEEGEVHSTWHSPCATPSEASVGLPELDRDRVRRRVERQGDRLMRQRLACRRHEQLKELVELLPPAPPQLSRAARRAKEKKLREEREQKHAQTVRSPFCPCRYRVRLKRRHIRGANAGLHSESNGESRVGLQD